MNRFVIKRAVLRAAILVFSTLWLAISGTPSRSAQVSASEEFFADWLRGHGESNLVVDASGVGLKGNSTRLRSSLYGSEHHTNGTFTAELEFKVRIPDGREIVEYVAGLGDSLENAQKDARVNFTVSTFHVIYRSFLNPGDPHQTGEKISIKGRPRALVLGDTMTRSQGTNSAPDMLPVREGLRKLLASLPLSPQTHWIKIVYANHHSKATLCAATLDNEDNPSLTEAVGKLAWPRQEEFYMVKQFMVVK